MKDLLRSELWKLRSTRTIYGFLIVMIVVAAVTLIDAPDADLSKPLREQLFVFFTGFMTRVLLLVLGIRLITDEYRHGTIVPSLLAAPRRLQLLMAKLLVGGLAGALLATAAATTMLVTAAALATSDGVALTLDGGAFRTLGGIVGSGALWTVIGVAFGTLVRSQVVATVAGLVWLMGIEEMLKSSLGDYSSFLPGDAGLAMIVSPTLWQFLTGTVILTGFTALLSAASSYALMRRDVE